MNKFILFSILLIFFLLPYSSNAEDNYIIDGNIVYFDDENVYLSANPHTIYESGFVYFNLTSKNYNGNIDATFGFNTSLVKPKKAELYNENTKTWENFPLSFTLLSKTYQNCDKWYYIKDVPIISNKNYKLRIWIETSITTNVNNGKYLFAVKPSFETIQQSIDNNRLYVLDPWFNISFTDRQKIIITTNGSTIPQNYQILLNVTYNSNMQNDFNDLRFTNLSNGKLSYWIELKINLSYALIWVNLSDEIIHPNIDIIYMYYGNNNVNSESNITNTMLFGDDFIGDLSKWNESTLGSGASISIISNQLNLIAPNSSTGSANVYTNTQFTNDIIIESKRLDTNTGYYIQIGLGTGDLVDNTGGSSNWWNTFVDFGYNFGDAQDTQQIYKSDGGGSNILDNTNPYVYNQNIWHKIIMQYRNNGYLIKWIDGTLTGTPPTDISHLSTSKYLLLSRGGWSGGNRGGITKYDYIFIHKYIENEPIINYNVTEYYTNTLYYNITNNYNHTIESDGTIIVNRSLNEIDNTYWIAKSTDITYWIFTKEINSSGYTNFTIKKDNLNDFTVKLKQYSYYSLNNSSLVNIFNTNQYGISTININLISDDYYIKFINQSLIPPPIKPLYPIQGILIFKDDLCINNINKIVVYKNNSYFGIYNYSDEIIYLNNTDYTFFINYDNIDIINSENFLITFFKNYGYILISIILLIILLALSIYFFKKVKR